MRDIEWQKKKVGRPPAFFVVGDASSYDGGELRSIGAIERLIEPSLEAMGYDLVRVRLSGGGPGQTLQVMAERKDRRDMSISDCAEISRSLSAVLDVADPISGAYNLEVSSPGLDRPLVRREDFERFSGHEARIETHAPVGGRKRFRGRLAGLAGNDVVIACDGADFAIPFDAVARAKLVLTDERIAAAMKRPAV